MNRNRICFIFLKTVEQLKLNITIFSYSEFLIFKIFVLFLQKSIFLIGYYLLLIEKGP